MTEKQIAELKDILCLKILQSNDYAFLEDTFNFMFNYECDKDALDKLIDK